ncbi:MAG: type II toxin-antitoxin system VapC family toxin [Desulfobacula sp.]|nr:type II toxin-antitoxin system VapC family toxin [Desulfobacula sp.]
MKILIDTHIYLWMLSCPEKLNEKRRYELESPSNEILLSAMSIAELMIKSSIGKIKIEFNPIEMAQKMRVNILDFSGIHALALGKLPLLHKDPFDRMIIVQALCNKLALMSDDSKFKPYPCKLI